jgi:hypothetical protein
MLIESLIELFDRDLEKLKSEINAYSNDSNLWVTTQEVKNSGGTLCLHLIGNLRHFIGATIGKDGYVRNRLLEFSDRDVPKEKLIASIDEVKGIVKSVLGSLEAENLEEIYPINVLREGMTTTFFLMHLLTHLDFHLGQISYHRRLIDK